MVIFRVPANCVGMLMQSVVLTKAVLSGTTALVVALAWGAQAEAGRIGFLVAEYPGEVDHHDSYVITIDENDTARLTQARTLVSWIEQGANPQTAPDGRIVAAKLLAGSDGINRNVLAPGQPLWSWHVTGEVEFVDLTIEILDGWPQFIEDDVPGWMANTNSALGFWGYTVVRELGMVPEPNTALLTFLGLAGFLGARR